MGADASILQMETSYQVKHQEVKGVPMRDATQGSVCTAYSHENESRR